MAHLYKRANSPYWWIKMRDARLDSPTFGKTIRFSTGLRIGVGRNTRAAEELCAGYTHEEKQTRTESRGHPWSEWVMPYLQVHCKTTRTLERYREAWRNLRMFFNEQRISSPRGLTREHCLTYLDWRSRPDPRRGKYNACRNTALDELQLCSLLMREAVRRGFAVQNPAADLGVTRHPRKTKPELTDAHIELIRTCIEKEAPGPQKEFLSNSFEIARYQGCRLHETYLNPMADVDLRPDGTGGLIRFVIKGGRPHTAPLHPKLVPLFRRLQAENKLETYPVLNSSPSTTWYRFFERHDLRRQLPPGACFHSLRVTAVTRLARSGVTESKAMKFIGHATKLVHRSYQRLRTDDLKDCLDALGDTRPTPGSPGSSS